MTSLNFEYGVQEYYLEGEIFSCPLYSKCIKVVEFSFTPTKDIFDFSFSLWFQFIQRIEKSLIKISKFY